MSRARLQISLNDMPLRRSPPLRGAFDLKPVAIKLRLTHNACAAAKTILTLCWSCTCMHLRERLQLVQQREMIVANPLLILLLATRALVVGGVPTSQESMT